MLPLGYNDSKTCCESRIVVKKMFQRFLLELSKFVLKFLGVLVLWTCCTLDIFSRLFRGLASNLFQNGRKTKTTVKPN